LVQEGIDMAAKMPDERGHFGEYGGMFVPEPLVPALQEIQRELEICLQDDDFLQEYHELLREYVGRPTPLSYARRLSEELGINVWLKREDLNHTGAHKINNAIGQVLLARRMGKSKIIAETGAGQHGVATATVCAHFGLSCRVFMGEEDIARQRLNVFRMELLGAEVVPVSSGSKTLKDATNEAIRTWVSCVEDSYYIIGSAVGPHPYPKMVREFQAIIGKEARRQFQEKNNGADPELVIACVGGGSNAIGIFHEFLESSSRLVGLEAGGLGLESGEHAATITAGEFGVLHGSASLLIQDSNGQVVLPQSISAGLDYPGIGPEHAYLKKIGRVRYVPVTDAQALDAFQWLTQKEGILPALETSHALAYLKSFDHGLSEGESVIVCVSGRGDKDVHTIADYLGKDLK